VRIVDDVILDPVEFVSDRAELNLSEAGLEVRAANWGDAAIEAFMVRQQLGEEPADRHPPNREVVLKLGVRDEGEVDLPSVAYRLQQKFGLMQREGGWLRRDFIVGGNFTGSLGIQVKKAALSDFAGWQAGESPDVTLSLTCGPYWYATEEIESDIFESDESDRELIFELAEVLGTAPGLIRVRASDDGEEAWRGLIFAAESRDHPQDETADTTAALAYDAVDLTLKGGAVEEEREGEKVVRHESLTAGWLTILDSEIDGVGHMTHRGVRRLWTRIWDPGEEAGGVQLRLRWRALGSLVWSENSILSTPLVDDWAMVDLGEARPEPAALGDERWEWQVQARALSGTGVIDLQRIYPLPTEQYAMVKAPDVSAGADVQSTKPPGTADAAEGSDWVNPNNIKNSDNSYATAALTVAGLGNPQNSGQLIMKNFGFALPEDATVLGFMCQIERKSSEALGVKETTLSPIKSGVIHGGLKNRRESSAWWSTSDEIETFGSATDLWGLSWEPKDINDSEFGIALSVCAGGKYKTPTASVDFCQLVIYYTEAADENRVCFATRSIELRSDGIYRQHPDDDVWGALVPEGFLPYAPPSGLEERKVRGIVIPTQGDLTSLGDSGSNQLSSQIFYRPGYHFSREAAS
jgi:hypothetical protein